MRKLIIIILFLTGEIIFSQVDDKIITKNSELKDIKSQISDLEADLNKSQSEEKESYKFLEKIDQQIVLIDKLLNEIRAEEKAISKSIAQREKEIDEVKSDINNLKSSYANYVVWTYKHGSESWMNYLFSADNFTEFSLRYKYLDIITSTAEASKTKMQNKQEELSNKKQKLENDLAYQEAIYNEKIKEKARLKLRTEEKNQLIAKLDKDQEQIEAEIEKKRKAEVEIKGIIARLYEEQRRLLAKAQEEKLKGNKNPVIEYDYDKFQSFSALQGKMNWPVRNGKVVRKFGENENTKLKTITLNYGLDISTSKDANVFAVAEGIVSKIDWIPGFGSIIIVTHQGEYRTVYGHITNIQVREGEQIKGGDTIGKVNQTLEGNIVHFEIWNERNYQNPEIWLVRR